MNLAEQTEIMLKVALFQHQVNEMSEQQVKDTLVQVYTDMLIQAKTYEMLIKEAWFGSQST